MYEEYLKDPQGYTLLDAYGNPVPVELQNSVLGYETDRPPTTGRTHPLAQHAKEGQSPSRRIPLARRPIAGGSPGVWNDLKTWWSKLPSWQKGALIGVPVVAGIAVAATAGKGEGKAELEKV